MEELNKLESCIKIIKKLPVSQIDKNITAISTLIYDDDDLLDNFLQKVDNRQNFCQEHCFIKSEYNRDGDSYRSPITNSYYPPMEDGRMPSKELRSLEENLNKIFSLYTNSYYWTNSSSGICSCYCWDLGSTIEEGFAVAVLIRHLVEGKGVVESGLWETTNVVNVTFSNNDDELKCNYKLTTYVQLKIGFGHNNGGIGGVSGTLAAQMNQSHSASSYLDHQFHATNIGTMIEENESTLRQKIEGIYFKKSKEIISSMRDNSPSKHYAKDMTKMRDLIFGMRKSSQD